MPTKPAKPSRPRPTRESFYVRIETGDGGVAFVNATEHIGKPMPFRKPRATCAMSVTGSTVSFSLLHLSTKNASMMVDKPVEMPRGPLARLDRRASSLTELTTAELVVELSTRVPGPAKTPSLDNLFPDPATSLDDLFPTEAAEATDAAGQPDDAPRKRAPRPATIETWRYNLRRDENNVVSIEAVDDEHTLTLPTWPLHVSLYLKSPATGHMIAVNFIGHIGKPGVDDTIGRVASMVLNSMSHLPEFRILAGVETVAVPAPPARGGAPAARKVKADLRAAFAVKAYLFDEAFAPVGAGLVGVEFDLVNANPTSGRLLLQFTPGDEIVGVFDRYRTVLEQAVAHVLHTEFGDERVAQMTYDIILGGLDATTVDELRQVGAKIAALDLSPTQWKPHT
jgi:hypothetical protein